MHPKLDPKKFNARAFPRVSYFEQSYTTGVLDNGVRKITRGT